MSLAVGPRFYLLSFMLVLHAYVIVYHCVTHLCVSLQDTLTLSALVIVDLSILYIPNPAFTLNVPLSMNYFLRRYIYISLQNNYMYVGFLMICPQ